MAPGSLATPEPATLVPTVDNFGQPWPGLGQIGPGFDQIWPSSTELGPSSAQLAPPRPDLPDLRARLRPIFAQIQPSLADDVRILLIQALSGRSLAGFRPNLGPDSIDFDRLWPEVGQTLPRIVQLWSSRTEFVLSCANFWPTLSEVRQGGPSPGDTCANSAESGPMSA